MLGNFADTRTDVTTTTNTENLSWYLTENGEPITETMVDTAENVDITQSSTSYGNPWIPVVQVPVGVSIDLGNNVNLNAHGQVGYMFDQEHQFAYGGGVGLTGYFGKKSE